MNLVLDRAPLDVDIEGATCPINADFRTSILFEMLLQDSAVSEVDCATIALNLYYDELPPNINEALRQLMWFYRCGTDDAPREKGQTSGQTKRLYDFEQDTQLIYAAFYADYGIDLESVPFLHWWKFKALFENLRPENILCKIMEYRGADLKKLKGEQRSFYSKMQRTYAIKKPHKRREKLDKLDELLIAGGDVTQLLQNIDK